MLDVHTVTVEELSERFGSDVETGLSSQQAKEGNDQFGLNELTPPPTTPEWVKFLKNLFTGFSMLLWAAAILSFAAFGLEHASSHGHPEMDNLYLGFILIFVVTVSAIFSYYQEAKSSSVMESFKDMVPKTARVRRNGEMMDIMAKEVNCWYLLFLCVSYNLTVQLTLGDIVEVKFGDQVPADLRILEATGMKVDNSSLTGESDPQVRTNQCTDENPLETKNLAFFGTNVVEGTGVGMVVNIGDNTVMGRIAELASGTDNEETWNVEIKNFIKTSTTFAVYMAFFLFLIAVTIGVTVVCHSTVIC